MVITRIISTALNPVMLTPNSLFKTRILRVTMAMERPKERAVLSRRFICLPLKNTSVQAKPGRKNIKVKPSIALMIDRLSRTGNRKPAISLSTDKSQSTAYSSLVPVPGMDAI